MARSFFYGLLFAVACAGVVGAEEPATPPSPLEICAPATFDAALACLDTALTSGARAELLAMPYTDLILTHHGLGAQLRNVWGLWGESPLYRDMAARGFRHPDDISMTIIQSFWLEKHGCGRKLEEQLAYSKAWGEAYSQGRDLPEAPNLDCTTSQGSRG